MITCVSMHIWSGICNDQKCNDQDINSQNTLWEMGKKRIGLIKENGMPQLSFSYSPRFFYQSLLTREKKHQKVSELWYIIGPLIVLWKYCKEDEQWKVHLLIHKQWTAVHLLSTKTTCICSGCRRKYQLLAALWLHMTQLYNISHCPFINIRTV